MSGELPIIKSKKIELERKFTLTFQWYANLYPGI